ncbi:MAG: substrate-binding domain-containing protein [Phycisphaeraceae bacterium]|nr:substrate-binding domain-containing protein [Phycisphaeraceae bacterium]
MIPPKKIVWMTAAVLGLFTWVFFQFGHEFKSKTGTQPVGDTLEEELLLYCGAGIQPVAEAMTKAFSKASGITVNTTYAGSGRLLGQLASSQVGDLFMPGSAFYVERAVEQKLVHENTRQDVAYFIPVIVVQKGNPLGVTSLADLARLELRLGLGDERAVAVGKQSKKLFDKNLIPYTNVENNVVYRSGTVNELGVALQMKHIDAAIMWNANARQFASAVDVIEIPAAQSLISTIPVVVLTCSRSFDDANSFVNFVTSPEGKEILREFDYTVELKH